MITPHTEKAAGRFLHNDSTIKQRREVKAGPIFPICCKKIVYIPLPLWPSIVKERNGDKKGFQCCVWYIKLSFCESCIKGVFCEKNKGALFFVMQPMPCRQTLRWTLTELKSFLQPSLRLSQIKTVNVWCSLVYGNFLFCIKVPWNNWLIVDDKIILLCLRVTLYTYLS